VGPTGVEDAAMADITIGTKRLREARLKAAGAALLLRKVTPHLVKAFFESLAIQDRIRSRLTRRKRRTSRMRIGAYAVGGAAAVGAGAVAVRKATHHPPPADRSDLDRV
jgi:hypothetical protein